MSLPQGIDLNLLHYAIVVQPEAMKDGTVVYMAHIPDLPGCRSHGATVEAAQANVLDAQREYLETLVEQRKAIPTPSTHFASSTWTIHPGGGIAAHDASSSNRAIVHRRSIRAVVHF